MSHIKLKYEDHRSLLPNYWHTVDLMIQDGPDVTPRYTTKCRPNVSIVGTEVNLAPEKIKLSEDAICPECKHEDMAEIYAYGKALRKKA